MEPFGVRRTLFSIVLQFHREIRSTVEFKNDFKGICFIKPGKLYGQFTLEIYTASILSGDVVRPGWYIVSKMLGPRGLPVLEKEQKWHNLGMLLIVFNS